MLFIKICGITQAADALAAAEAGADAVGFVFAESKRRISPPEAKAICDRLPGGIARVGVFVAPSPAEAEAIAAFVGLDYLQIHGELAPGGWQRLGRRAIRGVSVGRQLPAPALVAGGPRYLLLDAYQPGLAGGTGKSFAWPEAAAYRALGTPLLVAGGLNPYNVREALAATLPDGVDASSGVEAAPGSKDHRLMRLFVEAARAWEETKSQSEGKTADAK